MVSGARPRGRSLLRAAAWLAAGGLLAAAFGGVALLVELRLDGGRLIRAAMGDGDLADLCRPSLARRLADMGFQPAEIELGPEPALGSPWARERSFGDSFSFADGAAGTRVDGVMACVVSRDGVRVEVRVSAPPRRAA